MRIRDKKIIDPRFYDPEFVFDENECEDILDPRFCEPGAVIAFRNANKDSFFPEIVIGLHKDRKDNVRDKKSKYGFVSLLIYSREEFKKGSNHPFKDLKKEQFGMFYPMEDKRADKRYRIGKSIALTNPLAEKDFKEITTFLHKAADLPKEMCNTMINFLNPAISVEELTKPYPEAPKDEKPTYFDHYDVVFRVGHSSWVYTPESDARLPSNLPPLFKLIINEDYQGIQKILETNPALAKSRCHRGHLAHKVAADCATNRDILKLFYKAFEQLPELSDNDECDKRRYNRLITDAKDSQSLFFFNVQKAEASKKKYKEDWNHSALKRPYWLQACVDGDVHQVLSHLKKHPDDLQKRDVLGFDALTLAAANGHVALVKQLLKLFEEKDIKISDCYEGPSKLYFKLVDQIRCHKVMGLILPKLKKGTDFSHRLFYAIKQNDVLMVEAMLFYIEQLPEEKGLSVWEVILANTHNQQNEMRGVFLNYYEKCYGQPLFGAPSEYLKRLQANQNRQKNRPKLHGKPVVKDHSIIEIFKRNDLTIKAIQKPISALSPEEKEEMFALFTDNFSIAEAYKNSLSKESYFQEALADSEDRQIWVHLFYDTKKQKLISFLTTEVISASFQKKEFILFHGKLACNNPEYSSLNLTNIGFRTALVERQINHDKPVYAIMKAIPPGHALNIMDFVHTLFSPKNDYFIKKDLLNCFAHLIGETILEKKGESVMLCKLEVNMKRLPKYLSLPLKYFHRFLKNADEENAVAMPVSFQFDSQTCSQYLQILNYNGVSKQNLKEFASCYHQLRESIDHNVQNKI